MALYRRQTSTRQQLFTGVALLGLIGATLTSCAVAQEFCPSESLVYPDWSICDNPAVYGDQVYIVSGNVGLVSEYDESNQTYYIRLTGESGDFGSLYTLTPVEADLLGSPIPWNGTVVLGGLTWRNEGESGDLWFLVDCSNSSTCDPAVFTIVFADIPLPCPLIYGARCEGYYLISTPGSYSSGLARYVENGVTYITLGDEGTNGDLPIVFVRGTSATKQREALRTVV